MTTELVLAGSDPESGEGETSALTPAQALLRKMVLDSVSSPHSRRNYGKALDHLFAFCASRPASLPGAADGVAGGHGVARALDGERPALSRPQAGGRGA
jgi:hypothetical protein